MEWWIWSSIQNTFVRVFIFEVVQYSTKLDAQHTDTVGRRFNSPNEGSIIPLEADVKILSNIIKRPSSSASLRHKSRSWNVHWIRF